MESNAMELIGRHSSAMSVDDAEAENATRALRRFPPSAHAIHNEKSAGCSSATPGQASASMLHSKAHEKLVADAHNGQSLLQQLAPMLLAGANASCKIDGIRDPFASCNRAADGHNTKDEGGHGDRSCSPLERRESPVCLQRQMMEEFQIFPQNHETGVTNSAAAPPASTQLKPPPPPTTAKRAVCIREERNTYIDPPLPYLEDDECARMWYSREERDNFVWHAKKYGRHYQRSIQEHEQVDASIDERFKEFLSSQEGQKQHKTEFLHHIIKYHAYRGLERQMHGMLGIEKSRYIRMMVMAHRKLSAKPALTLQQRQRVLAVHSTKLSKPFRSFAKLLAHGDAVIAARHMSC